MTNERVKMVGQHYVGTKLWDNGVVAGVRWDGFAGQEQIASDRLEALPAKITLTEKEREAGFYSIGSGVYLAPRD